MRIFISWSGDRSKEIAIATREFLLAALGQVEFFLSDQDIELGQRGMARVAEELDRATHAVLIVTNDNVRSQWMAFEAGAISGRDLQKVMPICVGIAPELPLPLGQFQAVRYDDELKMRQFVKELNTDGIKLADVAVDTLFKEAYAMLKSTVDRVQSKYDSPDSESHAPSEAEKIDEILATVRALRRSEVNEAAEAAEAAERLSIQNFNAAMDSLHDMDTRFRVLAESFAGVDYVAAQQPGLYRIYIADLADASQVTKLLRQANRSCGGLMKWELAKTPPEASFPDNTDSR